MLLDLPGLNWRVINDDVMGGLSSSSLDLEDGCLVFRGELSTENRGGFASVLGALHEPLDPFTGFRLSATGDGRRYQFRLRETESGRDVAWRAFFNSRRRSTTTFLERDDFHPVMRGQPAIGARPLAITPIHFLGFMLTSRRPGPFEVRIHSVEVLTSGRDEERAAGTRE
jgi:hypothetical protein